MNVNVYLLNAFNEYVKALCGDSYNRNSVIFKFGPDISQGILMRFEPTSGGIDPELANEQVLRMKLPFVRLMHPSFDILIKYKEITFKYELNMAGKPNENGDLIPPFFELHVPRNALAQRRAIKLIGQARALLETSCR